MSLCYLFNELMTVHNVTLPSPNNSWHRLVAPKAGEGGTESNNQTVLDSNLYLSANVKG